MWGRLVLINHSSVCSDASHLTCLSMGSVDDHLLLCEPCSSVVAPHAAACHSGSGPRCCSTPVCIDLRLSAAPPAFFRGLRYRHGHKSFIKPDMEQNQSADKCFARVFLLKHAPREASAAAWVSGKWRKTTLTLLYNF